MSFFLLTCPPIPNSKTFGYAFQTTQDPTMKREDVHRHRQPSTTFLSVLDILIVHFYNATRENERFI